jgi:exosortase/archaeosortase family protein
MLLTFNMNGSLLKKWREQLSPYSFLIKFLFLFAFLYGLFPFMRGITSPDGKFYAQFVADYLDIVKALTRFLTNAAKATLELLQYETRQRDYQTLRIEHSRGIIVNPSCLGWGVMSFWTAFVLANKGVWQYKLKWIFMGLFFIMLLNTIRIALVALANHLHWHTVTSLDHHLVFNILSYCIIALMIAWFIKVQKKYEARTA